jgi:hypothetical protein
VCQVQQWKAAYIVPGIRRWWRWCRAAIFKGSIPDFQHLLCQFTRPWSSHVGGRFSQHFALIAVHFLDSYFKKKYAYFWINPDNFDLYTAAFDSAFLERYRTLASMGETAGGERILEMRWIELLP